MNACVVRPLSFPLNLPFSRQKRGTRHRLHVWSRSIEVVTDLRDKDNIVGAPKVALGTDEARTSLSLYCPSQPRMLVPQPCVYSNVAAEGGRWSFGREQLTNKNLEPRTQSSNKVVGIDRTGWDPIWFEHLQRL